MVPQEANNPQQNDTVEGLERADTGWAETGRGRILQDASGKQRTRRWIKLCLLLLGGLMQLFRILNVQSSTGETPFLSANDRSRWCTILALTVNGSYVIDEVIEIRADSPPHRRTWYTIDMVQHRGWDGKQHFYSSKPPLLPTMYAGVYWVVRATTGATLTSQPFFVARVVLVVVNLLPLLFLWWMLIEWADRMCSSHNGSLRENWQFVALAAFAVFGTFLSTFVITLNNHLPAAVAAAVSLWAVDKIICRRDERMRWFILAGLATSFTAANELPAVSWVVIVAGVLALVNLRKTCVAYLPALIPVTLAFFFTNYLAHGTWRPAYSQRAVGAKIATLEMELPADLTQLDPDPIVRALKTQGVELTEKGIVRPGRREGVWELWDDASQWRIAWRIDGPNQLGVYHWGDWYDYPNSYWVEGRKKGVDRGEPSMLNYAFHCLVGHHGILSLTPFWLLSFLGVFQLLKRPHESSFLKSWLSDPSRILLLAISVTSIVVIGFYLTRPLEDRNYGGVCSGLRWSFWLIPFWFWLAAYGISSIKTNFGKIAVAALLGISLFSATYPWSNPWTSPWYYQIVTDRAS